MNTADDAMVRGIAAKLRKLRLTDVGGRKESPAITVKACLQAGLGGLYDDAAADYIVRAVLRYYEAERQPQPGRVEGMATWFVSGSHGWPGGIEFRSRDEAIAHIREHDGRLHFWIHQANRKDYTREEVAAMLAAVPTAGGDA